MKAYLTNLPAKVWMLLAIPAILIAYPIAAIVVPAILHAMVPDTVRTVLHLM